MNRKLMFSNENNAWTTPREFFAKLNEEFNFTLDPCCMKKSALCKKYYTPKEDGLKQDWEGEVAFVNPPYGREIKKWVEKCFIEGKKKNTTVVLLIPARTDTTYFHNFIYGKSEIRFLKGRLKFVDLDVENPKLSPAPFPSMIVIFKGEQNA